MGTRALHSRGVRARPARPTRGDGHAAFEEQGAHTGNRERRERRREGRGKGGREDDGWVASCFSNAAPLPMEGGTLRRKRGDPDKFHSLCFSSRASHAPLLRRRTECLRVLFVSLRSSITIPVARLRLPFPPSTTPFLAALARPTIARRLSALLRATIRGTSSLCPGRPAIARRLAGHTKGVVTLVEPLRGCARREVVSAPGGGEAAAAGAGRRVEKRVRGEQGDGSGGRDRAATRLLAFPAWACQGQSAGAIGGERLEERALEHLPRRTLGWESVRAL